MLLDREGEATYQTSSNVGISILEMSGSLPANREADELRDLLRNSVSNLLQTQRLLSLQGSLLQPA